MLEFQLPLETGSHRGLSYDRGHQLCGSSNIVQIGQCLFQRDEMCTPLHHPYRCEGHHHHRDKPTLERGREAL